jgi:hypothetical protein
VAIELFIPLEEIGPTIEQRKGKWALICDMDQIEEAITNLERILEMLKRFKNAASIGEE